MLGRLETLKPNLKYMIGLDNAYITKAKQKLHFIIIIDIFKVRLKVNNLQSEEYLFKC